MRTEYLEDMVLRRTGEGPPVLWLHGLGESSLCFERLPRNENLRGFHHCLLDLPGYGRSPWSRPVELEMLSGLLQPVLERIGRTFVVGHSMGGVLAVLLAERFGRDSLRGVVNIEGNISLGDCSYSGQIAGYSLSAFVSSGHDRLLDRLYRLGEQDPAHRGYFVSMRLAQPEMLYQHSRDLIRLSEEEGMVPRMEALGVPLLYLAGVPDGICSRSARLLGDSSLEYQNLTPCGHWPFLDEPDAVARSLREWMERVP